MNILERLREETKNTKKEERFTIAFEFGLIDLINQYDLALKNALLKLKNRDVQIADLKARLKEKESKIKDLEHNINNALLYKSLKYIKE